MPQQKVQIENLLFKEPENLKIIGENENETAAAVVLH
jgi:hypothetical protein